MYDPNSPGFSDLHEMREGSGYWVKMTSRDTLKIYGTDPGKIRSLTAGWNLVGYNSSASRATADALASIEGKYISIWAFIDGAWKVYDPANPGSGNLTTIEPGYGYWINATEDVLWILPQ